MNKIKIMKSLVLLSILLFMVSIVHAVRFPSASEKNWATSSIYGLEKWLLESHTVNGTLKSDMNISANDLNISNNLIVLGNISGEIQNSFKSLNWSNLYIAEANTRYSLRNFTSNYDSRTDRFSIQNGTALPFSRFTVENVTTRESVYFRVENGTNLPFSNMQIANITANERNPSNSTILITLGQVNGRDFTDGVIIGSGTNITKHLSTLSTGVVTASIATIACGDLANMSVTGASVGDIVVASPTAVASGIETTNLIWNAYISATNTIKIRACNPTAGNLDILDTQSWRADVWKH